MKLLARILNRVVFLTAESSPDGSCRRAAWLWHTRQLTASDPAAARKHLAALVICGHGVVTKPDDSEIAVRVRADGETFLASSVLGQTSFVRRERIDGLLEELATEGIIPVRVFCAASAAELPALADAFAAAVAETLRWRWLLRPEPAPSAAAQALVRRVGLPLLGTFLLLLAANAACAPALQARKQALLAESAAREKALAGDASADALRQELLAAFGPPIPSRAVLCDRIAEAVPARVVLTGLGIEPLTGRFEAAKPLLRRERTAIIAGTAPEAADISEFVRRLSELPFCREVRLAQVSRQRDGDRLTFRIEAAL